MKLKNIFSYQEILNKGEKPKNYRIYEVSKFELRNGLLATSNLIYNSISEILTKLSKLDLVSNDPKTACLINHLDLNLPRNQSLVSLNGK